MPSDFSESVTGFTASDITITGGTLGDVDRFGCIRITYPVTAGVGSGSDHDYLYTGKCGHHATQYGGISYVHTLSTGFPTITITTTDTDIRENETFNVDISFSESVTGFAVGDITVTGASINALTGSRFQLRSIADSEFGCR